MMDKKWQKIIDIEKEKDYFKKLKNFLIKEYKNKTIYPKKKDIFNALELTPFKNVKVIILGQDPYHQPNQAHGLSFSVKNDVKIPPSLKNIIKEINDDLNVENSLKKGNLSCWAKEGVLLLNTILTVEKSSPLSHAKKGWEIFTNKIIKELDEDNRPKVFMLWGSPSRKKKNIIKNKNHLILEAPHPSPLSSYRGFFGCKHFSKANNFLKNSNQKQIDWKIK